MTKGRFHRLPRDLVAMIGLGLTLLTVEYVDARRWGLDSHAYWAAWRGVMYGGAPDTLDAYLYSPAFAQTIWPLAQLPWPVFGLLWSTLAVAALVHLFRPLGWQWVVPLLLCCAPEILTGNIFWLLALVATYGVRWPALWALPLLTKVTPGVGLLWFVVRREWRSAAVATGTTGVVIAFSYLAMPGAWHEWVSLLLGHASSTRQRVGSSLAPPLLVRLPVAVTLITWTALTNRRWGVPAAMIVASPVAGVASLVVLAALPRLGIAVARPQLDVPRILAVPAPAPGA